MDLLTSIFGRGQETVNYGQFLAAMALSMISAFILGRAYIHWGQSISNREKLAANFVLIALATCFIITIVKSSIALSLGLVGALSITRFRAAIKEPEELTFLFLAIALGIGYGANFPIVALMALAVCLFVLLIRSRFSTQVTAGNYFLIIGSATRDRVDLKQVTALLTLHSRALELVRLDERGHQLEVSYNATFDDFSGFLAAREALLALDSSLEICFMDPTVGA